MLIKELFSEYTDNIPNPVGRGELLKICHSKDGKQMVLFAKFTQLQRFDNLDEFERAAAKAVGLDYLRVKCRYTPDMLDAKYTGEAVKRLKQDMAVINGHLNGAFYYIDNNTDRAQVYWVFDDGYATIRTTLNSDVLHKMITSIGG